MTCGDAHGNPCMTLEVAGTSEVSRMQAQRLKRVGFRSAQRQRKPSHHVASRRPHITCAKFRRRRRRQRSLWHSTCLTSSSALHHLGLLRRLSRTCTHNGTPVVEENMVSAHDAVGQGKEDSQVRGGEADAEPERYPTVRTAPC